MLFNEQPHTQRERNGGPKSGFWDRDHFKISQFFLSRVKITFYEIDLSAAKMTQCGEETSNDEAISFAGDIANQTTEETLQIEDADAHVFGNEQVLL